IAALNGHSQNYAWSVHLINKQLLASGDTLGAIKVWDLEANLLLMSLDSHSSYVRSMNVMSDGSLVSVSDDKTIKFWNLTTATLIRTISDSHGSSIYSVKVLFNGNIVTCSA